MNFFKHIERQQDSLNQKTHVIYSQGTGKASSDLVSIGLEKKYGKEHVNRIPGVGGLHIIEKRTPEPSPDPYDAPFSSEFCKMAVSMLTGGGKWGIHWQARKISKAIENIDPDYKINMVTHSRGGMSAIEALKMTHRLINKIDLHDPVPGPGNHFLYRDAFPSNVNKVNIHIAEANCLPLFNLMSFEHDPRVDSYSYPNSHGNTINPKNKAHASSHNLFMKIVTEEHTEQDIKEMNDHMNEYYKKVVKHEESTPTVILDDPFSGLLFFSKRNIPCLTERTARAEEKKQAYMVNPIHKI